MIPDPLTLQVSTRELLAIADKLQERTGQMFSQPAWSDKLLVSLVTTDREHGCLRSAQILRDHSPDYDSDKAVFMVMLSAEEMAMHRCDTDAEVLRIRAAIAAAEKAAGVGPDDEWEDALPEVNALYEAISRRETELEAEVLREYGETELADLLLTDDAAYHARREPGRLKIYGPVPDLAEIEKETEAAVKSLADAGNDNPTAAELHQEVERLRGLVSSQEGRIEGKTAIQ